MSDLLTAAAAWLAEDPDPQTRAELQAWIDANDTARLAVAFAGPLTFGTAGLRGPLGPGPASMNHIVVAKAAAGLAQYVKDTGGSRIVIGYDARRNSQAFAELTAAIAAAAVLTAEVLPPRLPTPLLADDIMFVMEVRERRYLYLPFREHIREWIRRMTQVRIDLYAPRRATAEQAA